jgi:hypothetical protein
VAQDHQQHITTAAVIRAAAEAVAKVALEHAHHRLDLRALAVGFGVEAHLHQPAVGIAGELAVLGRAAVAGRDRAADAAV